MKKRCAACNNEEQNFLSFKKKTFIGIFGLKQKSFCQEHLLEQFSSALCNYNFKMVVLPPYLQKCEHLSYSYQFYPITASKHLSAYASIKKALGLISGKCQLCPQNANVAFYDKENINWRGELAEIGAIEAVFPRVVCNACAMTLIRPYLKEHAGGFGMGLDTPFGGEGYYMLRDW